MFSHLKVTSICKNLAWYLHTPIPVEKNESGLDTTTISYFAKWLIFRLCLLIKLHKYLEETQLSRNASKGNKSSWKIQEIALTNVYINFVLCQWEYKIRVNCLLQWHDGSIECHPEENLTLEQPQMTHPSDGGD